MSATTSVITVRLDKDIKEKSARVFEDMGTDLSGGIKLFLNNVVNEGSLGFTPMSKDGLKFKYFREYRKKLANRAKFLKEAADPNDPSIDRED